MNTRLALYCFFFLHFHGLNSSLSHASEDRILLDPVDKYSYCTPYTPYGKPMYSLGVVGTDWALTFELQVDNLSGNIHAKISKFYRGPNMHYYVGKSAGPRRPPIPNTNDYTYRVLTGIDIDIHRVKIYDNLMGPIEVLINDFSANSQQFHITKKANIECNGPDP